MVENVVKVVRKCLTHRGAAGTMTCLNASKVGTAAPPRVKHFCNTFIIISGLLAAILLHFSALSQKFSALLQQLFFFEVDVFKSVQIGT